MTFRPTLKKVNILLVLALLAALLVPVMGVAAGQTVAFNTLFDSGTAETAHPELSPGAAIACGCGDPGGQTGCC